ncbi:hypothetical protein SAY87_002681 [Trapa incisa]|uniref:Uncharacterized protein n=1 Tax=Trapa incisa TaxID=236973 RepID=A0AAN7PUR7_9MYRT|nr:hypothetical protein SAY87_002681 [Trapa incisa]
MGNSSDDDISESEMDQFEQRSYEELKSGSQQVKLSDETFTCPYCPKKRRRYYLYQELLQHVSGVDKSTSDKSIAKEKAGHLALKKYLEKDLGKMSGPVKPVDESGTPIGASHSDKFVWPWKGIVVNIPTIQANGGRCVGESGSRLRDEYIRRGFNPTRVMPLWNYGGHSGYAVVEFEKGWLGLHNAMCFEQAYEAEQYGRQNWIVEHENPKSGLYAWVAREADYNLSNILGDHLRKVGNLKTIPEMMEEEAKKQDQLVSNLTYIIEEKNKHMQEIEGLCNKKMKDFNDAVAENDKLLQKYNEELRKLQSSAHDHIQRIFNYHEMRKSQFESHMEKLKLQHEELVKREAKSESEWKKQSEEISENTRRIDSLMTAAQVQQMADEEMLNLAEEQKRQKEELHNRIMKMEKELDEKQALELEIVQLRGSLKVLEHMEDEDGKEVFTKIDGLLKGLQDKEEQLADLEVLRQTLTIKERRSNDELQDARKELITGLQELPIRSHIRVKRMGELDSEPFLEAMRLQYNEDEAEVKAYELCSLWEEYLRDPSWHPFQIIQVDGEAKRIIKSEDEKLRGRKEELGEKAYNAVINALVEVNEFNASGSYVVSELWNYKERRKATLEEGVDVLLDFWNTQKRKRIL